MNAEIYIQKLAAEAKRTGVDANGVVTYIASTASYYQECVISLMESYAAEAVANSDFHRFAAEHSAWSQATFGTDAVKGPSGPAHHLEKEAKELQKKPHDAEEWADALNLVLDGSRRAGINSQALIEVAFAKLEKLKHREWGEPDENGVVEHIRSGEAGGSK